jgi:hypothetical protein
VGVIFNARLNASFAMLVPVNTLDCVLDIKIFSLATRVRFDDVAAIVKLPPWASIIVIGIDSDDVSFVTRMSFFIFNRALLIIG